MNPLERRLSGHKKRSEHCGVEKNLWSLPGIELRPSIPLPVAIPTEKMRLPIKNRQKKRLEQLERIPEKATTLLCAKGQLLPGIRNKSVDQF
jgi:hypothetical protein